ncbi:centrosomal protein 20 [Euwallacea similis]|uniref:centrosomal protein 20 n=1 Tax=Euwallacea similis TaxID=1736056 RepID=UPI00344EAE88
MNETTEADLLQAIKESLQKDGTLGRFKGEIRAAVMNVLNKNSSNQSEEPPKIPDETKLINELIREYLVWNGYFYADQVLGAESSQCGERVSRDVLTAKLGVLDDSKTAKIPLLYYIVSAFQANEED